MNEDAHKEGSKNVHLPPDGGIEVPWRICCSEDEHVVVRFTNTLKKMYYKGGA